MDAMEPNVCLVALRLLARRILDGDPATENMPELRDQLAERFQALDAWLMSGGFAPEAWLDKVPAPGKGGLTGAQARADRQELWLALERMGYPTEGRHTIELPIATVTALVGLAAQVQQLATGEV